MPRRARTLAFAVAAALVVAGAVCAALAEGVLGEVLTIVLLSSGFAGLTLLAFLLVGMSEDRERMREEAARRRRAGGGMNGHRAARLYRRRRGS